MSTLTKTQQICGIVASILGIIQGIAWFVLAILCIDQYNRNHLPDERDSYDDYFSYYVYTTFLYKNSRSPFISEDTIVTPKTFFVFMWIYVVTAVIWVLSSAFLMRGVKKDKITLPSILVNWGLITSAIAYTDLVLVILIGYDYNQNCANVHENAYYEEACAYAIIPMLIMSARGFVLWILNLVFAILAFILAYNLTKKPSPISEERRIDTLTEDFYEDRVLGRQIPRATLQSSPSFYLQQSKNANGANGFWNVNLRTAYDNRTPPTTPISPLSISSTQQRFFNK